MGRGPRAIEWLPASAADLTRRRQRVSPADEAGIDLEELLIGVGAVVIPVWLLVDPPVARGPLILFGLGWFLVSFAILVLGRHGLYLCLRGVTVQRGVWPRDPIPWAEVDGFCLVRRRQPLSGGRECELVAVRTIHGDELASWKLNREVDFEDRRLPVEFAKAKLRSFPALVDQLNRITAEVRRSR